MSFLVTNQRPKMRDQGPPEAMSLEIARVAASSSICQRLPDPVAGRPPRPSAGAGRIVNSIGMELALVPAGEFLMGSGESEEGHRSDEQQHSVRITKPFYMGVHEVTQEEYERVMGTNPSYFSVQGDGKNKVKWLDTRQFPVEQVTWDEAREFCCRLSELPGEKAPRHVYRLPTEAEWEYACRAGATTPFSFGHELNGARANCIGDNPYGTDGRGPYLQRPTRVGSYSGNAFGLFDMHGNVWEWCLDRKGDYGTGLAIDPTGPAASPFRVIRGGSWVADAVFCRSACRGASEPANRHGRGIGFRVVWAATLNVI